MRTQKIAWRIAAALFIFFSVAATVPVSASGGEKMSVRVNLANIRSGPGTNHNVIWKVEKYHPVKVLKMAGKWCHFEDFEGDRGWIFRPLLSEMRTVIVKGNNCNVRSGPGTNYDILFKSEFGVPYKVSQQKDKWLKIEHADGDSGWIHRSLVW